MRLAVCVKQVPVSEQVSVDPVTNNLVREGTEGQVNPADLNALQCACDLRETAGGSVTALTMGPSDFEAALRTALATGADQGVLITDRAAAGSDTVVTARVLAGALNHLGGFDLILFGNESSDGATGQVGPMTAELLGLPHVTKVQDIQKEDENHVLVVKQYKNQLFRLRLTLPAVVAVSFGCNEVALPTLMSQMEAEMQDLTVLSLDDVGLSPDQAGAAGSPTRVAGSYTREEEPCAEMLSGSLEEQATAILRLIQEGLEENA